MHENAKKWVADQIGPRPCDWCGHLGLQADEKFIHVSPCTRCSRSCYEEERKFYVQLGYDGESDVKLPQGYKIHIPK